jgi:Tol biopolymer transport system component
MILRMALAFVVSVAAALATPAVAQEFIPLRAAIPDFDRDHASSDYAAAISEVVRADMRGPDGVIIVGTRVPTEATVDISLTPRWNLWTALNVRMLVVGNVKRSHGDGITVQYRVWDPYLEQQTHKGQLTTDDPAKWEDLAHRVADDIRRSMSPRRS